MSGETLVTNPTANIPVAATEQNNTTIVVPPAAAPEQPAAQIATAVNIGGAPAPQAAASAAQIGKVIAEEKKIENTLEQVKAGEQAIAQTVVAGDNAVLNAIERLSNKIDSALKEKTPHCGDCNAIATAANIPSSTVVPPVNIQELSKQLAV